MIKIEIWSDINCPFCYIGKRHLERALQSSSAQVEIEWKSFELDPTANPAKGADQTELLAKKYGRTIEWAKEMNQNMTNLAAESGLEFHMDKLVPANSFHAHRLIHLAKVQGKQDQMKERLLKARFTEGLDIGDKGTLLTLAQDVGVIDAYDVLSGTMFEEEVRADENMAREFGISGVPFFVFNRKYALSGAQPVEAFKEVLSKMS